ncbi:hypothetical protein AO898_30450 [Pseudomonas aeruginosa]|nr:hypothetical protein AO898_30450 [Pseudomonas aeruginosa]
MVAADEVQNLLTRADLETVPVARSLGLYLMFATQNIDGLYKRLEKDGAVQMLGNLASIIGVVCGRGRNPTLRLWPTIFSGKIDVFPGDRRSRLISSMTSVAPA